MSRLLQKLHIHKYEFVGWVTIIAFVVLVFYSTITADHRARIQCVSSGDKVVEVQGQGLAGWVCVD